MSDFTIGGVKFDSEKVFPKKGNTRADDVAKIYREAIEFGVKEGADHFIANNINKDKNGKDNYFTDERGNKFRINHATQQKAIDILNKDVTFPYYLEKDSKKSKGGSKLGYLIRDKTKEELQAKDSPKPTAPTTKTRTTQRAKTEANKQ